MITWENFDKLIEQLPSGEERLIYEENRIQEIPQNWQYLGNLADRRIDIGMAEYFTCTKIAIGFYPYSGCDIYNDEKGRIILTYIELGGHFPFRRNFILSKNTPVLFEPVSIRIDIPETDNEKFIHLLGEYGLDKDQIEEHLAGFKEQYQINKELDINQTYVYGRYFNKQNQIYYYTIIATRNKALQIQNAIKH